MTCQKFEEIEALLGNLTFPFSGHNFEKLLQIKYLPAHFRGNYLSLEGLHEKISANIVHYPKVFPKKKKLIKHRYLTVIHSLLPYESKKRIKIINNKADAH